MATNGRDSGSIVLGWMTKLFVIFAVLGVLLYDGVALTVAHLSAEDDANDAARAAASAWHASHDVQAAYDAALATVTGANESIPPRTFVVNADGSVRLELSRTTETLVMRRVGPLRQYTVSTVTGEAPATTL